MTGKRIKHILNCHAFDLQETGAIGVQLGERHTKSSQHINTRGTATSHTLQEEGPFPGGSPDLLVIPHGTFLQVKACRQCVCQSVQGLARELGSWVIFLGLPVL